MGRLSSLDLLINSRPQNISISQIVQGHSVLSVCWGHPAAKAVLRSVVKINYHCLKKQLVSKPKHIVEQHCDIQGHVKAVIMVN